MFFSNLINLAVKFSLKRQSVFNFLLRNVSEGMLVERGKNLAYESAMRAYKKVPAYKDFVNKTCDNHLLTIQDFPVSCKKSYIMQYNTESRCVFGSFLLNRVAIDESSGSSGIPYNWVRGEKERIRVQNIIARTLCWFLPERPVKICINAFSMGAWATGVNMGEALSQIGVVKSAGPDIEKILNTLKFFGDDYQYVLCGYPPFLKILIKEAVRQNFPIKKYKIDSFVGGEAMSEELRHYILQYFQSCTSGYGASDLEMGIATESKEAIKIRNLLNDNESLRRDVLGEGESRLPMIFQYNPLIHYIELNDKNELLITLNQGDVISPRIRYNIEDQGKIFLRSDLIKLIEKNGFDLKISKNAILPFPYLMVFGRSDSTVSIMGANIYPQDIEKILYKNKDVMRKVSSFMLGQTKDFDRLIIPQISIELNKNQTLPLNPQQLSSLLTQDLIKLNLDFKNAYLEYSKKLNLDIKIYNFKSGPFSNTSNSIKKCYIRSS